MGLNDGVDHRRRTFKISCLSVSHSVSAEQKKQLRDSSWETVNTMLATAVGGMLTRQMRPRYCGYSPELVLRSVQALVDFDEGDKLYKSLESKLAHSVMALQNALHEQVRMSKAMTDQENGAAFQLFLRLTHLWELFITGVREIQTVWLFFGEWIIHRSEKERSVEQIALLHLRKVLHKMPDVMEMAVDGFLLGMKKEMDGYFLEARQDEPNCSEHSTMKATLCRFVELTTAVHLYKPMVLPAVLETVRKHHEAWASQMVADDMPASTYFTVVNRVLKLEKEQQTGYTPVLVAAQLAIVSHRALLGTSGLEVLTKDFGALMTAEDCTTLALVGRLLFKNDDEHVMVQLRHIIFTTVRHIGEAHMRQLVQKQMRDGAGPVELPPHSFGPVVSVIELLRRGECVITTSFPDHKKELLVSLHEALEKILLLQPLAFCEMLAKYLDYTIRCIGSGALPLNKSVRNAGEEPQSSTLPSADNLQASSLGGSSDAVLINRVHSHSTLEEPLTSSNRAENVNFPQGDGAAVLVSIAKISSHHPQKDVLESYFWRDLERRLLHSHSRTCLGAEESFKSVLKVTCGTAFSSNYEAMLRDVRAAEEVGEAFHSWVNRRGLPSGVTHTGAPVEDEESPNEGQASTTTLSDSDIALLRHVTLQPFFLTNGFWPDSTPLRIRLPPSWQRLAGIVEQFYHDLHPRRSLTWQHQRGFAVLRSKLRPGAPEQQLTGTVVQCAILMEVDRQTDDVGDAAIIIGDLLEKLDLDPAAQEVVASLRGLCHDRCKLLLWEPSPEGEETRFGGFSRKDTLRLNLDFTFKSTKVRLPLYNHHLERNAGMDAGGANEHMEMQRSRKVEVEIVRYMKANQKASLDVLLDKIPEQCDHSVTAHSVQMLLNKLTLRGFLSRDREGNFVYVS